jgi:hypothetical protein
MSISEHLLGGRLADARHAKASETIQSRRREWELAHVGAL